jgi:hypothetical protein
MVVFISYANEDRDTAEQVNLALTSVGHQTFFDRANLPPGKDFHGRISTAVQESDVLVFLASPDSTARGNYALTELKLARERWPNPNGHIIPVRLRDVPFESIPNYLKAVTVLEPEGNLAAEVVHAVSGLRSNGLSMPKSLHPRKQQLMAALFVAFALLALAYWFFARSQKSDIAGAGTAVSSVPTTTGDFGDEINSETSRFAAARFVCYNGLTARGQSVYVVGSIPELGNWDPTKAVKLDSTEYPDWSRIITNLPPDTRIDWKCIKRPDGASGPVVWQPNRNSNIVTSPPAGQTADKSWESRSPEW